MINKTLAVIIISVLAIYAIPTACLAETVVLKSGERAEGKILKKANTYIVLESQGETKVYFLDDIELIYDDDGTISELSPKQEIEKPLPSASEEISKEKAPADAEKPVSEVMVYLKSGEVVSGNLLKKTDDVITIERRGQTLSFKPDEVSRIEQAEMEKVLPAGLRLPFSTAIINYVYKGWQTGKESAYIDAKKNKVAIESATSTSFADMTTTDTGGMLYDGEVLYMIELEENKATIMKVKGDIISYMFGESLFQGDYSKDEQYLGKQCKVYEREGTKAYYWKGICLKEEITKHLMGDRYNYTKEAVDIKLDVAIPPEKLKLPAGIKIETIEEVWGDLETKVADLKGVAEEASKEYQEHLLEQSKEDPELKEILKKSKKEDGTIDFKKVTELMEAKREEELLQEAKGLEGGDELIRQATKDDGTIDTLKLGSLLFKKRTEITDKYNDLTELADFYRKQEEYPKVVEKLTEAIRLNPARFYAYSMRADAYETMGEYDKAIADYTEILDKEKDADIKPYYLTQRAELYERLNRYQEALDDYTESLRLSRERTEKDMESKKALFEKYGEKEEITKLPKTEVDNIAGVLKDRGNIYRKMGRYEDALRDFSEAIEQNPGKWILRDCYFFRGLTYKMMNKPTRMRNDLEKAKSLGDKLIEGSYLRGKKHGHFRWYYTNGNVKTEGDYVNGKQDGMWRWYNEDGSLMTERMYRNDKPLD